MTVESSWVDQNFKPKVIGQVQWAAYEIKETLEFSTPHLPTSAKHSYISVKKEGVTCSAIDNRIISQLKYIAPKIVKTGPKKYEMIQGKKTEMEQK